MFGSFHFIVFFFCVELNSCCVLHKCLLILCWTVFDFGQLANVARCIFFSPNYLTFLIEFNTSCCDAQYKLCRCLIVVVKSNNGSWYSKVSLLKNVFSFVKTNYEPATRIGPFREIAFSVFIYLVLCKTIKFSNIRQLLALEWSPF